MVQQIFYHNQSLLMSNSAVSDPSNVFRNLSLAEGASLSLFPRLQISLSSNCSFFPGEFLKYWIGCGSESGNLSGLAVFENDGILGNALERCKNLVLAPVELYGNDELVLGSIHFRVIC